MTMEQNNSTKVKEFRWGILGCAGVARAVAVPGIIRSNNGKAVAVASRDLQKANDFATDFNIERAYGSYSELLEDPDVDGVYIPLPNNLHYEWTIRAAEKGKHVLCEKPLALNENEARDMVQSCHKAGVLLMEAFAHRFHPQNMLVRQKIQEGKIGKIVNMTAVHSSGPPAEGNIRLNSELGGGVMGDKGCYCMNTARFLMGAEPVRVFARVEMGKNSGVDERVSVLLEFPDGAHAWLETSFQLSEGFYQQGYEVQCEFGRVIVPNGFAQLPTYRRNEVIDTEIIMFDLEGNMKREIVSGAHQWQIEMEFFADCAINNKPITLPGEDGLANIKVMDAIYQSGKTGKFVELNSN